MARPASRQLSRIPKARRRRRGRLPLHVEELEPRVLLAVAPVTVADPHFYGDTGNDLSGAEGFGYWGPSFSADGQRVAFASFASNLVPDDTNGFTEDVFVRDLGTGTTTLVSANSAGTGSGNDKSYAPLISADGRYVFFVSKASDLVANGRASLYRRDLVTGTTALVSVDASGNDLRVWDDANYPDYTISPDGRRAAWSDARSGGVQGPRDVWVRDLTAGTTTLVSVNVDGTGGGNGPSSAPFFSADGRFVAFQSDASNLVANDNNNSTDVFVRDLQKGTTTLVSANFSGSGSGNSFSSLGATPTSYGYRADGLATDTVFSPDGRYVVFTSNATDLVTSPSIHQQENGGTDVYLRDLQTGTTTLVSVSGDGARNGDGPSGGGVLTPDGRFVAFWSQATNLASGTNAAVHVFVRDLRSGTTTLVSVAADGSAGTADRAPPSISTDGRFVGFTSTAGNLTAQGTGGRHDVFVRDLQAGTTTLVSINAAGTAGGGGDSALAPLGLNVVRPSLSPDGRRVLFVSGAPDLVANDNNGAMDVFERDLQAGTTTLVSRRTDALPAAYTAHGGGADPSVSADGRFVAFDSTSPDLVPNGPRDGNSEVYVRDLQTGTVTLLSDNHSSAEGEGYAPVISGNGRYVFFASLATNLTGDSEPPGTTQLFRRDLQTGTTTLVSVSTAGNAGANQGISNLTAVPGGVVVTPDGRFAAFFSQSTDLVPGYTGGAASGQSAGDLYVRDLQLGTTTLVSASATSPTTGANQGPRVFATFQISADGRFVAFESPASNLVADDTHNTNNVFVRDLQLGTTTLVSANAAGTASGNAFSENPVLSSDGRFVAFDSYATDLVTGVQNNHDPHFPNTFTDVYLRDLQTGTTTLVSTDATGTGTGDYSSAQPVVSADGRFVAFSSSSDDLVPGGTKNGENVFVRDTQADTTSLVSVSTSGGDAGGLLPVTAQSVSMSGDGRFVAFQSTAADLVPGFTPAGGTNPPANDYIRDLQNGTTTLISANTSGTGGGDIGSGPGAISTDGSTVVFASSASNLYAGDRNAVDDVFAFGLGAGHGVIRGHVFADANGNGMQDPGEPGLAGRTVFLDTNGNGRLDPGEPTATTDGSGSYAFTGLAAGTYTVAEVLPAHYKQTLPAAPGTYTVTLPTGTETVTGRDFGDQAVFADLVVQPFSTPAAGQAGQTLPLSWTVQNQGDDTASGSWQDAVYVSTSRTVGPDARLLDVVPHTGDVAPGGTYTATDSVTLPALPPGSYYPIVVTDRRGQVNEGPNRGHTTTAAGNALTVTVPVLALGTPLADQFTAAGQDHYYQLALTTGDSLLLTLQSAATDGATELYVRQGALPTPWDFDARARVAGQPGQRLVVPTPQAGTYYVLAHGVSGGAATSGYTLTATQPGYGIQGLDVTAGGNTGPVTIPVHGTDLTPATQVSLVAGGRTLTAQSIDFGDPSVLYATFDLTGQPVGSYDVRLSDGSRTATAAGAFTVVPGQSGPLQLTLTVPAIVRSGRPTTFVVDYVNTGNTDLVAPLLQVTSPTGSLGLPEQGALSASGVQLLALSPAGPAGVLRPGQHARQALVVQSTTRGPINFQLSQAASGQPMNWPALKDQLRPEDIPADAWDAVFANFVAAVGTTVGQYNAVLAADAGYLQQLGESVPDVQRLLNFEILKADNAYVSDTLDTSTDGALPTPGLALDLEREYEAPISGRYRLGPLGRGWVYNWQITAQALDANDVVVQEGGTRRLFTLQPDGSYRGLPGDYGVLTLSGGVYRLQEHDGTLAVFRPDGQVDYVQDTDGNRVTAGYDGQRRLSSLTHSDGESLTLTYNAQGRVSQVVDSSGRVSTYAYDAGGEHLLTYTDEYGATTYTYLTGQGLAREHALASIAYAGGAHVFFSYDGSGRLVGQHGDNNADAATFSYGTAGAYTVTDTAGGSTTVLQDDGGQVRQVNDALGQATRLTYDASHNLTQVLGPTGAGWNYGYDATGDLTSIVDPLGHAVTGTYDANGNLLSYQDAGGNTVGYRYDAAGDLVAIAYPDGSSDQFSYDAAGDPIQAVTRGGQTIRYTFDPAGNVTRTDFPDGTFQAFTYDAHGNELTATDAAGTIAMAYDAARTSPPCPLSGWTRT